MTLTEIAADETRRSELVHDTVAALEAELESKSGAGGLALKAGYGALKKIKPGMVQYAVEALLPDMADALEPHRVAAGSDVSGYFESNADAIAEDLLAITDQRAQSTGFRAAASGYARLRGSAKGHVLSAMPRLARLVEKYAA